MNGIDAVQVAFRGAHMWFDGTTADISAAQAAMQPPGRCPTVGALMAHVLHCEDGMLSMFVTKTQPLWQRDGWEAKTGVPWLLEIPQDPPATASIDLDQLRAYTQAVFAQTDATLARLTAADLDGELDLTEAGMGKMPLGAFLVTMLLGNTYAHTSGFPRSRACRGRRATRSSRAGV